MFEELFATQTKCRKSSGLHSIFMFTQLCSFVVMSASLSSQTSTDPFNILILGDGDFSFTLSFCNKLKFSTAFQFPLLSLLNTFCNEHNTADINVCSTSFDGKVELMEKYPNSERILKKLSAFNQPSNKQRKKERNLKFMSKDPITNLSVTVLHHIDATDLSTFYQRDKFNLIIFNHPHLGIEDVKRNGSLVMHVLCECHKIISKESQIWITLLDHQWKHWRIARRLKTSGLELALSGSFPFFDGYYPGYTTKRHQSGRSFRRNRLSQRALNDNGKQRVQSMTFVFTHSVDNPLSEYLSAMNESVQFCVDKEQKLRNTLSCRHCGRLFLEERSLLNHQKSSTQCIRGVDSQQDEEKERFECDRCGKTCSSENGLAQHILAKHEGLNNDIKPDWYCAETNNANTGIKDTVSGKGNATINENAVHCKLCGVHFIDQTQHKEWITPAAGDDVETFRCYRCRSNFTFKRDLLQHLNVCLPR